MPDRSPELQHFIEVAGRAFADRAPQGAAQACVRAIFAALEVPAPADPTPGRRRAVCDWLDPVTDPEGVSDPLLAELCGAFRAVEPALTWRQRPGPAPGANAQYREGHANAMIAGPSGLEPRDDVWLGVSLLGPEVRYPDHDHPPEETYLVLTPGRFFQEGTGWFEPGPGGSFYNRPGILHAMAAGASPLLALWALRPETG